LLLDSDLGVSWFCEQCPDYETCSHTGSKIYTVSQLVIDFMFEIENGFKRYYWEGSLYDQPLWFMQMLRLAQKTWNDIRKKAKK